MRTTTFSDLKAVLLIAFMGVALLLSALPASAKNKSICAAQPKDAFFQSFQCGRLLEVGYTGELSALRGYSRAEVLQYISGLSGAVHGQSAPFFLHPQVLSARDPHLPRRVSIMMLSDRGALKDTFSDLGTLFGQIGGAWLTERHRQQSNGTIDPLGEISALGQGMASSQGSAILWAAKYGEHDFQTLAAISQSDPDLAIALYDAMSTVLGGL